MGKGTESGQGGLSVERMCQLAEVSRAGYYRQLQEKAPQDEAMAVRAAIQQITLEHRRRYGYRRVTAELRRRGMAVNHKRVTRLMREDHLLGLQPKAFVVTTQSEHDLEVYLNLAWTPCPFPRGVAKLTFGVNSTLPWKASHRAAI